MAQDPTRRGFVLAAAAGLSASTPGCARIAFGDDPGGGRTVPTTDAPPTTGETPQSTDDDTPVDTATDDPDGLEPPEKGAAVFVYDDGRTEDCTEVLPVHEEFGFPATSGVVSGRVGRKHYMDVEQLRALAEAGWEIASHTVSHTPVGQYELTGPTDPEDTELYASHTRHGHHEGTTLQVTDGDRSVRRTIKGLGEDDDGTRYIVLAEPVGASFESGETVVRSPPEFVEDVLAKSKRDLEAMGFRVDSLLAPYDAFDAYSMRFVPEYYDYVANARLGSAINRPDGFDPYETARDYYIEYTTAEAVEGVLDGIAETGALGVFGAHPAEEVVTQERVREVLEMVEARGIRVMTLREACRRFTADG